MMTQGGAFWTQAHYLKTTGGALLPAFNEAMNEAGITTPLRAAH